MSSKERTSRTQWSRMAPLLAVGMLSACGGASTAPVPVAPSMPSEVESAYAALGNACNAGFLQRGFNPSTALEAVRWAAPDADPGAPRALKRKAGWTRAMAVLQLGSVGFAEDMTSTSALQAQQCGALRELFSPLTRTLADGRKREANLSVLLYADDHQRPAQIPPAGETPLPTDAPVRLTGYLDVSSAQQGATAGVYSEVRRAHLPIQVSCSRPLKAKLGYITVDSTADLDPNGCTPSQNEPGKSICMFEELEHVAGNECSFVAVGVNTQTLDEKQWWMSFGGKLTASSAEPVSYQLRVDRMVFHEAPAR